MKLKKKTVINKTKYNIDISQPEIDIIYEALINRLSKSYFSRDEYNKLIKAIQLIDPKKC